MLDQNSRNRLAFIRYIYRLGLEQTKNPYPLCSTSILSFHDSVDMFLQLVYELKKLDKHKKPNKILHFLDYLESISEHTAGTKFGLTRFEEMKRLNTSRINLKHKGLIPSKIDVDNLTASVSGFFQENVKSILDVSFDDISMIDLIEDQEVRTTLEKAKNYQIEKNYQLAFGNFAIAFDQLIYNYLNTNKYSHNSPFEIDIPANFRHMGNFGIKDPNFHRYVQKTINIFESIQSNVKILSLGLDFRRYCKFRSLIPSALRALSGDYHIYFSRSNEELSKKNDINDDCYFCLNYIVESALHLQNFKIKD